MGVKFFIYVVVSPIVIYSMDSLNINQIFKKNKVNQARVFYLLITLALIYLITNFTYDFFVYSKFY